MTTALALLAFLLAPPGGPDAPGGCDEPGPRYGDRATACEVRELSFPATGALSVDNRVSGAVRVVGWDRDKVAVRAVVRAYASDSRTAEDLLAATVIADGDALRPRTEGGGWVETAFVVRVPRRTDLDVDTNSGVVSVVGVVGRHRIHTNNGVLRLEDVGGAVEARSHNGDVTVNLAGEGWDGGGLEGAGLRAFANNGTLRLRVPEPYDALVEADVRWGFINAPDGQSPSAETRRVYFGPGSTTLRVGANSGSVRIERV